MCAMHCINNLLQIGPVVTPEDLSEVALELDQLERELMLSQGADTADAIKYLAQDSSRVDDSGNFGLEVISTTLQKRFNLTLSLEFNPEATAYILNYEAHWFTVRKLDDGEYYDLNSMIPKPKQISKFYLHAYLAQMKQEGYDIFVVQGTLPNAKDLRDPSIGNPNDWCEINQPQTSSNSAQKNAFQAFSGSGNKLSSYAAAASSILGSMASSSSSQAASNSQRSVSTPVVIDDTEDDDDLQAALAMSLQESQSSGTGAVSLSQVTLSSTDTSDSKRISDYDEKKLTTIEIEDLANEPANSNDVVKVMFIMPNGEKIKRMFRKQCSNQVLYQFVTKKINASSFSLASAGLGASKTLNKEELLEKLYPSIQLRVVLI